MGNEHACETAIAGGLCESERGTPPEIHRLNRKAEGADLATESLVLAIASWPLTLFCFTGVLTALVAIPLGHIAIRKARRASGSAGVSRRAVIGLIISYVYVGLATFLIAKIIANNASRTSFWDNTGMDIAMHTPGKGTSCEWRVKDKGFLWVVMAPERVQLSGRFNVVSPVVPENLRTFEFLTISYLQDRHGGTVIDAARNVICGMQVWDKTYTATDPGLTTISAIPSAFSRESLAVNGVPVRGIIFFIPGNGGHYVLTFRSDPDTYNESFYRKIAGTFKPKECKVKS